MTINVPVVYMARYVMVFRRIDPLRGALEWKGWALEIETFLGPKMAASEAGAISWPKYTVERGEGSVKSFQAIGLQVKKKFFSSQHKSLRETLSTLRWAIFMQIY